MNSTLPWIVSHGALHYRACAGRVEDVTNPSDANNYRWANTGLIFPQSKTRFRDVIDGTTNTILLGNRPLLTAGQLQ